MRQLNIIAQEFECNTAATRLAASAATAAKPIYAANPTQIKATAVQILCVSNTAWASESVLRWKAAMMHLNCKCSLIIKCLVQHVRI